MENSHSHPTRREGLARCLSSSRPLLQVPRIVLGLCALFAFVLCGAPVFGQGPGQGAGQTASPASAAAPGAVSAPVAVAAPEAPGAVAVPGAGPDAAAAAATEAKPDAAPAASSAPVQGAAPEPTVAAKARYRPVWAFEAMRPELEALRLEAERLSDEALYAAAAEAWGRLASGAGAAYGPGDLRAAAAAFRRARSLADAGEFPEKLSADAASAAEALARISGADSAEALFASETALRLLADGKPAEARDGLAALEGRAAAALGALHPQTLSIGRSLAAAALGAGDAAASAAGLAELARLSAGALGPESPETLETDANLAAALYVAGDLEAAGAAGMRSFEGREAVLGPDHPDTLLALTAVAYARYGLGRMKEARDLFARLHERQLRTLGPDHRETQKGANGLASLQAALGEYGEARRLHESLLESLERTAGPESREALTVKANLAEDLRLLGLYAESLDAHAQVLEARKRTLGPDHPDTVLSLSGAAAAMFHLGDVKGVRGLLAPALAGAEKALGPAHPYVLVLKSNLAAAEEGLGGYAAAAELLKQALEGMEGTFGAGHPDTEGVRGNLAAVLFQLGEYAQARDLDAQALAGREKALGENNPATVSAMISLAYSLAQLGDLEGAGELASRAASAMEASLGPDHPETLSAKEALGWQLMSAGDTEGARALFSRVLEARVSVLGPDHPDSVYTLIRLASAAGASRKREDNEAARDMYLQALEASSRTQGPYSKQAGMSAEGAGRAYARLGFSGEAVFFAKVAVDVAQRTRVSLDASEAGLGRGYLRTVADRYHLLFDMLMKAGRRDEALAVLGLLKEDELSGLEGGLEGGPEPASAPSGGPAGAEPEVAPSARARGAAAGGDRGAEGVSAEAGGARGVDEASAEAGGADLFTGTPEEAAHRAWLSAAGTGAAIQAERAGLQAARAEGKLDAEGEARLSALGARAIESGEAFQDVCRRLGELLGAPPAGGGEAAPAAGPMASLGAESLKAAQRLIGGSGAALVYAVSAESALYLIVVTRDSVATRESPVGRAELESMAMEFRSVLQDRRKDPRPAGKRLYDALIRPLEGDLGKPGALLMLSLDGALRYVPAAALWDGNGWLAESRPTVIFTRATAAARDTAAGAPAGGVRARAMGVTRAWPGFPALPGVAAEIEAVVGGKADGSGTGGREVKPAGGVLEGESYLDEAFDRAALASSLASDAPVVHVASHFSLDPTSLEGTALLLGDGGRLSLGEMRSSGDFDFRGLDLLALSACDTGSGARRGETGKEVESLGELLQRAGASAVLATLLPVDDMSAPELVREFYRLRYVEGRDKASALQGAQLKVMRDLGADTAPARGTAVGGRAGAAAESAPAWEGKGFSHPYYWSPFVVMGDWR